MLLSRIIRPRAAPGAAALPNPGLAAAPADRPHFCRMRLTKLKLAGFKSFVDPTTVVLPGQLVGVVGPNGCGKSNIMDAVRWVLGESKASELRGESMQDVIFNGSSQRKPVARASVELVFDNSQGRALGPWSMYAELSVKRVLARTGQSDYFINQQKVRRKDITDLFLGTGLGPRAYAIIGQGMIARIIEARPEELRVFLEEAAGVTRYKERRKETQGRLEDSRENLARVEDIRQELGLQMEKLEAQAEVARRYRESQARLQRQQQLLWLLRCNEAKAEAARLDLEIARSEAGLEGALAALRHTENELEAAREAHFSASDALHAAQGALYAVNAEVARLEAEIRHREERRRQLELRRGQIDAEEAHWRTEAARLEAERCRWEELLEAADLRLEQARARAETLAEHVPLAREAHQAAAAERESLRQEIGRFEQALQIERTHLAHARRSRETLLQRRARLAHELAELPAPDAGQHATLAAECEELRAGQAILAARLQEIQDALPEIEARRAARESAVQEAGRALAAAEARHDTLQRLQNAPRAAGSLEAWLARHGLADAAPLWRSLDVEAGWETAVEAVLGERLAALTLPAEAAAGLGEDAKQARPGGALTLCLSETTAMEAWEKSGDVPGDWLIGRLQVGAALFRPALAEWLAGVRCAARLDEALARRGELGAGECFVTPAGDRVTRQALHFFAPQPAEHGRLERQRQIETLAAQCAPLRAEVAAGRAEIAALTAELEARRAALAQTRRAHDENQQRLHRAEVALLKAEEAQARYAEQCARLKAACADVDLEIAREAEQEAAAEAKSGEWAARLEERRADDEAARARLENASRALREAEARVAASEREVREAEFSRRECEGQLQSLMAAQAQAERQLQRLAAENEAWRAEQLAAPPEDCAAALDTALSARQDRESELAARRAALEAAAQDLREREERRLRLERELEPLRAGIGTLKLQAQAAALNAAQLEAQLQESGADPAALADELVNARPQALAQDIGRLQKAIAELGAVNLAALEELEAARRRKGHLDSQAADLSEAMATLENAIRRIDRETRELLQNTFDTVNGHFGRLFPELFGGGRAELLMSGEEILDAGVQVIAQPPGKKNATIQLLSGGEKALTAIALVFSFFQLNPAPFCLLDEVDAPLDDTNTERFCQMVRKMSGQTQFLFISHNKIAMEMAEQLVGVTMQESGVSRVVEVDMEAALKMRDAA